MTPKEKAKELVDKFKPYSHFWVHDLGKQKEYNSEQFENAKQCALICVDEILKEIEDIDDGQTVIPYDYWEQVKKEIEQL